MSEVSRSYPPAIHIENLEEHNGVLFFSPCHALELNVVRSLFIVGDSHVLLYSHNRRSHPIHRLINKILWWLNVNGVPLLFLFKPMYFTYFSFPELASAAGLLLAAWHLFISFPFPFISGRSHIL